MNETIFNHISVLSLIETEVNTEIQINTLRYNNNNNNRLTAFVPGQPG